MKIRLTVTLDLDFLPEGDRRDLLEEMRNDPVMLRRSSLASELGVPDEAVTVLVEEVGP